MSAFQFASIQGLTELARRDGVDIRPTLVRVLVDLYVQEPVHTPSERARFSELACRLLDAVDVATRMAVSQRLASYPETPAVVASRLARDEVAVAEPMLRRSSALGEAELHAILDAAGPEHAAAIASRAELPASIAKRLRKMGLAGQMGDRSPAGKPASSAAGGPALSLTLARRYLVTNESERRLILAAMEICPAVAHEERLRHIDRALIERLERAALRHQPQEFAQLLQQGLGLPAEIATWAVADPAGDPIVAICRALNMPFDLASRILLFLNPEIGGSVQRVIALSEWFETITATAARRLVGAWCDLFPPDPARRGHSQPRALSDPRSTARVGQPTPMRIPMQPAAARES